MERSKKKIVNFYLCRYCTNKDIPETMEPCADCLDNPVNVDSKRPIHFEDNGKLPKLFKKGE